MSLMTFTAGVLFPRARASGSAASYAAMRRVLMQLMRPGEGYFAAAAYGLFFEEAESAEEAHALLLSRFGEFDPVVSEQYNIYPSGAAFTSLFSIDGLAFDGGAVFCTPLISMIAAGHELPCCTLEDVSQIIVFDVERFHLPEGFIAAPVQQRTVDGAAPAIEHARRLGVAPSVDVPPAERAAQKSLDKNAHSPTRATRRQRLDLLHINIHGDSVNVDHQRTAVLRSGILHGEPTRSAGDADDCKVDELAHNPDDAEQTVDDRLDSDQDDDDDDELYFISGSLLSVRELRNLSRRVRAPVTGYRFTESGDDTSGEMSMLHVAVISDDRLARSFARPCREQQLFVVYDRETRDPVRAYMRGREYMAWEAINPDILDDECVSVRAVSPL